MLAKPPPPVDRPKLAQFIFDRDIDLKAVAAAVGCSHEQVRLICLPFADPRRRVPNTELMARIVAWTDGEIRPGDFYPPSLSEGVYTEHSRPVMADPVHFTDIEVAARGICRALNGAAGVCVCEGLYGPGAPCLAHIVRPEASAAVAALKAAERLLVSTPGGPPPRKRGHGELGAP